MKTIIFIAALILLANAGSLKEMIRAQKDTLFNDECYKLNLAPVVEEMQKKVQEYKIIPNVALYDEIIKGAKDLKVKYDSCY